MVCNVYDETLSLAGQITEFVSLRWGERYNDYGSVQLSLRKTNDVLTLFAINRFIGITGEDTLAIIKSIDDRNGTITIYAFECKYLLCDRIYDGTANCAGKIETKLREIIMEKRQYPFVQLGTLNNLSGTARSQRSYNTLFDISAAWCGLADYGFRLRHDKTAKKLLYEVYEGKQSGAKLSQNIGNLYNLIRTKSEQDYKNIAYVGGGGEGANRVFVTVGDTAATGMARHEMYVDARDIQRGEDQTEADYKLVLESRGKEKLEEKRRSNAVSFSLPFNSGFGKTFFLGDIITVVIPEYNEKVTARITGFVRTINNNTDTTTVEIGVPIIRRLRE